MGISVNNMEWLRKAGSRAKESSLEAAHLRRLFLGPAASLLLAVHFVGQLEVAICVTSLYTSK